ncbi:adenosine deaminase [Enteractinococcus fodinae]|uniref:adenosine deaminase n=1 Tax=Enteractinococcus fodinae TaxID=684663 RepID=A0ABU2B2H7_9MICC|nr:adenosine deaminase [Enteractinococcus fodinae]MDR7347621.1 adenosine deaminase [Enteractinococcus fodinae]
MKHESTDIEAPGPEDELHLDPFALDLASLPKVSLHDHLDGGLRVGTVWELSQDIGHELPAESEEELATWFAEAANAGSLPKYLEMFDHTTAVMQTAPALQRIAYEFAMDLVEDGVVYGEVRWAPEQHTRGGLSLDEAVEAVTAGLERAMTELDGRLQVHQILCAMRQNSVENAQEIAELTHRHRPAGSVVAFDIAGPEEGFPATRFADVFAWLDERFVPITIHAGEADGIDSIAGALTAGRALRIGHGVHIIDDLSNVELDDDQEIMVWGDVANRTLYNNTVLELCPTSNIQTAAVETGPEDNPLKNHPFDVLYRSGFAVTVNPDNRLISGVSLTDELYTLAAVYGYTMVDLLEFQLNAVKGAFQTEYARDQLSEFIEFSWMDVIAGVHDEDDPEAPVFFVEFEDDEQKD